MSCESIFYRARKPPPRVLLCEGYAAWTYVERAGCISAQTGTLYHCPWSWTLRGFWVQVHWMIEEFRYFPEGHDKNGFLGSKCCTLTWHSVAVAFKNMNFTFRNSNCLVFCKARSKDSWNANLNNKKSIHVFYSNINHYLCSDKTRNEASLADRSRPAAAPPYFILLQPSHMRISKEEGKVWRSWKRSSEVSSIN